MIEGVLTNSKIGSILSIRHDLIDMEFTLPRCRAGPLVVPFINYDFYDLSQ
jgi:hypothetical protein